jgi:Rieske Fe-S protein
MEPAEKIVRRGSRLNRIMLLRLDEAQLVGETKTRAAAGVVAYTAICTHTGCDVSDWLPDDGLLYCPCHFSKYDPKNGASVVDGPAPRPLPALPLRIAEGQLVVAGPFTARVTFDPA